MSIFRDRYVLKDGKVIVPDEILNLSRIDDVWWVNYTVQLCTGQYRTDRATGMQDSTGKEIFERDRVMTPQRYTGTIIQQYASWRVSWDDPKFVSDAWGEVLTITGMVPFEKES